MIRTLLIAVLSAALFAPRADACSSASYADSGRYVGGDLATQIARNADTIQVVRVAANHLYRRTYSEGEWYLLFGQSDPPDNRPEFINEYVYELAVLETLKGAAQAGSEYYENEPRILAYDAGEWRAFHNQRGEAALIPETFNALPDWLAAHPGHDGYAFSGGAAEGAGLGGGGCNGPYFLEVGQTFVAFRDSMGRLYQSGAMASNGLSINAEFRTERGRRERVSFYLQALVPTYDDDPLLTRLRSALRER